MLDPNLSDDGPNPPASWGTPWWHGDEDVYVKSERLGESPTWFHWSAHTGAWARRAPRTPFVPPSPQPEIALALQNGIVTLQVNGKPQPLPFGDIKAAVRHPRRPWVALIGSSPRHPPQPALWDVAHQRFLTPLREAATTSPGESIQWEGIDGFPLQGFFHPCEEPEAPLCLLIHDGPVKAARAGWPDKARALNAAGAHAFYVNYRGSEGLSLPGTQALKGAWGEKDVWDIVSAKNHLLATRKVSSRRFAIWGGRAGGYAVLNTVARYPNAFDVAIAVYPLLDPVAAGRRMNHQETLATWSALMGERASPLLASHLVAPRTRVRVYHGMEDADVPYAEVDTWVQRRKGDGWNITLTGYEGMGARFTHIEQWRHYHRDALGMIVDESRETLG